MNMIARGAVRRTMSSGLVCVWVLVGAAAISGCRGGPEMVSAPVTGYNHTSASVIRFSINGAGGPHILPHQGGGEVCCGRLPVQWSPNLKAVVEWDKDPQPYAKLERDQQGQITKDAAALHSAGYSHHSTIVEIPKYAERVCALQVHFLPCEQIRVSTTCFTPGHPNYPDKVYFQLKEPSACSKL
jgi:hypothetical protein